MDLTVLHTLEYYKVLEMLAARTGSSIGKELALAIRPSSDAAEVRRMLAETQEARSLLDAALTMPLGGIRDIRDSLKRCELGAYLEPHELLAVSSTLAAARRLKAFFADVNDSAPLLAQKSLAIKVLRKIENAIENVINEHGGIRDDASVELHRIRREIKKLQNRIKEKLDSLLHTAEYQKYYQDALVTIRGDRYVIPVKQEYRSLFPGIVHDQSASGATVFIEPMAVVNLNNDLKQAVAAERDEIERILTLVSAQIAQEAADIYINSNVLGEFDLINAKARLAADLKAEAPLINAQGFVNIRKGRHPLIPPETVVPIDIHLGRDFSVLLITGPNTGGKTVSLKTIGLFALMTQSGILIPAAYGSEMPVFNNIYADIGDEQSIEQSLSTFSAHMTNLIKIIKRVTQDDLVLIDEIGAGTDPDEGAALAMAMLDYFYGKGAKVIATTHYSELKTFAYTRHGIENASVEFDVQTLRPTYRLLIGVPGSSNAFAISSRLGLSEKIIDQAKHFLSKEHLEFEELLASLHAKKKEYAERMEQMAQAERYFAQQKLAFEHEQAAFAAKRNEIMNKAREEAGALLRQARRQADMIISQLKAQFAGGAERDRQKVIDGARQVLKDSLSAFDRQEADENENLPAVTADKLRPGMTVYVTNLKQKGTVIAINAGDVTVQLGILKMTVPLENCRLAKEDRGTPPLIAAKKKELVVRDVVREVDVRGMTVEEAEDVLGKFLDDAVLAGLNEVSIIHGKGTGALRKGLRAYLASHPHVKSISVGEFNQGGDGVTVVRLL
ncbi:MAG: endonuclease MutS2 [Negativicutes bacterium]|nr:endonuclease MutS2 [Negativicutes bacterium]